MSITLNFSVQNQSITLSEKELIDLQNAVTFAIEGSGKINKNFGSIRVETSGTIAAFRGANNSQQSKHHIETDC